MVDLGSHNGTYLNGLPVGRAPVLPGDIGGIGGIGHSAFVLVGDELREFVDTGEISRRIRRAGRCPSSPARLRAAVTENAGPAGRAGGPVRPGARRSGR
ncbi:FHA domain-containing protein [Streptomyces xantholiticus]|uniref:FHA domain-containing protein n=1 Tax=Streptomyces xantholiticus TaxID=68285 RepID=UPI003D9F7F35